MNKKLLLLLLAFSCSIALCTASDSIKVVRTKNNSLPRQLVKNIHFDYSVNKTTDYRWRVLGIGTSYGEAFDYEPDLSWSIGLNYNWSKYTFYNTGNYSLISRKTVLKTGSLTVPALIDYSIYKTFLTGVNLFTGPMYELLLTGNSKNGDILLSDLYRSHFGWTIGGRVRFLAIFSLTLSYDYYPTAFFQNGDMNRSLFKASFGF